MPWFDELRSNRWVNKKDDEQQVQPAVLQPLFKLLAQQGTFIDNDYHYKYPFNALNQRNKG
jgi:hypothetical protein